MDNAEKKVVLFPNGIIDKTAPLRFTLLYDSEDGEKTDILWLQSEDDADYSIPVIDPLRLGDSYDIWLDQEQISVLGGADPEGMLVLVPIVTLKDGDIRVDMKCPFVINTDTLMACQLVLE